MLLLGKVCVDKEMDKVKLGDVSERGSSNLAQKDIEGLIGNYPIYGAADRKSTRLNSSHMA